MARSYLALLIGASTATLVFAPSLRAENITFARGEVFVNHGSGFTPVTGRDELRIGDTVFAKPNGQAQVVFGDGCHFTVESGSALMIHGGPSPCAAGSNGNNDDIPNIHRASDRVDFQSARAIGP
jgi:hypothetical protein